MSAVLGRDLGARLCQVLGIDADHLRSIDIHVSANDPVTITTVRWAHGTQPDDVVEVLQAYELHEVAPDEPPY